MESLPLYGVAAVVQRSQESQLSISHTSNIYTAVTITTTNTTLKCVVHAVWRPQESFICILGVFMRNTIIYCSPASCCDSPCESYIYAFCITTTFSVRIRAKWKRRASTPTSAQFNVASRTRNHIYYTFTALFPYHAFSL